MRPSKTKVQRNPAPAGRGPDLASLITACGRDERPALQALFERTAPRLFGIAVAASSGRAEAEQALVQAYLTAFAEAEHFDSGRGDPMAWLEAMLSRYLPAVPDGERSRGGAPAPVEPPPALWQKLDIALGLKRLDRHIKPGIATQARGRDPMPNAQDRRVERQVRFWRVIGIGSFLAFTLAAATVAAMVLRETPVESAERGAADPVLQPAVVAAAEPTRVAILQAAEQGRVWRIDLDGDRLRVRALPPFERPGSGGRPGVLALWATPDPAIAAAEPRSRVRLSDLDPAGTTDIPLPNGLAAADFEAGGIELMISLEPDGAGAAVEPRGPVIFSGRFEP